MPFTLAQLQAEIQAHGYGTDTAAAQTTAINAALRDIRNWKRWPWDQGQTTTTTVANQGFIANPSVAVEPIAVRLGVGPSDNVNLDYLEPEDFRDMEYRNPITGIPDTWSWREGLLLLYPKPDKSTYNLIIDYFGAAGPLVNPSDLAIVPDAFINAIVWGAIKHLAYRERNEWAAAEAERQFQQAISRVAARIGLGPAQGTEVERSGFYDVYDGPFGII